MPQWNLNIHQKFDNNFHLYQYVLNFNVKSVATEIYGRQGHFSSNGLVCIAAVTNNTYDVVHGVAAIGQYNLKELQMIRRIKAPLLFK